MPRPEKGKLKAREKKSKLKRSDTPLAPPPPLSSNPYSNSSNETVACSNPFDDNSFVPRQSIPMPSQGMPGLPPQGMPPQGMTPQPMGVNQVACPPPGPSPGPSPGPNPMNIGYQTGPNHGLMRVPLTVNQSSPHQNQIRFNNTGKPSHPGSGGPSPMQSPSPGGHGGYSNQPNQPPPPMPQHGRPMPHMQGMMYSSDQPLIRNSQNQNAPPVYNCGGCHNEIGENDQALLCEAGCNWWYHQLCTGMTDFAFSLVKDDVYVEWACDNCAAKGNLPLYKYKP